MTEQEISQLVDEIENVDFREFWWDSPLLERASRIRDVGVIRALAIRHHGLSNKEAFSAHVIRNAIKKIDAPDFSLCWSIIDAEKDSAQIVQRLEDFFYAPWAVAYVMGVVGGAGALRGDAVRLGREHSARHYMIVRIASHLLIRFLQIQSPQPISMTMIDVKTGEMTKGVPAGENSPQYKMEMRKRDEADEYFIPVDASVLNAIRNQLATIPDKMLNCSRDQFNALLDRIPKR